jgi:Kef-type K+ transport system membrane component KefB
VAPVAPAEEAVLASGRRPGRVSYRVPTLPPDVLAQPLPLMVAILFLLLGARALGEVAERFGQPAMLGEIAAGILLGPSLLGWVPVSDELRTVAELGVFLLVVLAGMELNPLELRRSIEGKYAWIAVCSFFIPLAAGLLVGTAFRLDLMRTAFLGLCIAITALPVSVRTLLDLGILRTSVGQRIVSAAVFNDVLSLLALGVLLNMVGREGSLADLSLTLLVTVVKAAVFMAAVVLAYRALEWLVRHVPAVDLIVDRAIRGLRGRESLFAVTILFVLVFASLSEAVGLHFVVGAFFGAMLLSHELLGGANFEQMQKTASGVTMGFLAPVFFGIIGLEFDVHALTRFGLVAAVLTVAFASKIAGGYVGGRLAGLAKPESLALGYGLNGRGIMELVIATIALKKGFIEPQLFSLVVLVGVVTTLATPLLLQRAVPHVPELAAARAAPRSAPEPSAR